MEENKHTMEANQRPLTPREEWVRWIQNSLFMAVVPNGWKKHKSGVLVSRLDFINQERAGNIVDFGGKAFTHYTKELDRALQEEIVKLQNSRLELDKKIAEAKKKWFNRKEIAALNRQAFNVSSMAVGVNRALTLLQLVKLGADSKAG